MPDAVYPKYALRATGENQLNLSDAEQIDLRDCLDNQLISAQISGISQEIVHAVYRQTIRYNKREDDLCGSQLAELISTESKPYYCNLQVRQLAAQSVLIARDGHYGRILSINFNFAQWGKTPEENGELISDPEGFCAEISAQSTPVINPKKPATEIETQELHTPENKQISSLQAAIQTLSDELATLKALLQDVLPNAMPVHTDQKACKTAPEQAFEAPKNISTRSDTAPKNEAKKISDCSISTPLATLERCALHSHASRGNEKEEEDLAFPDELKAHEKNAICKALESENIKDKSTCQLLLDDLNSRFQISDWQPIRSPIAYFRSLIRSYKQGSFDESYVEDFRNKQKAAKAAQKEAKSTAEQRVYLDKYNDAKNKYENLKVAAQGLGQTLRDIAKDRGWTALIEEMGFDLDAAVPT